MRTCDFILTSTSEEDELREEFKNFIETNKKWDVQNIDQSTYCVACDDQEEKVIKIIQTKIEEICHDYKIMRLSREDEAYLICSMKRHNIITTSLGRMFKTALLPVDL